MDGHETWEDTLNGTYGVPELAFAPEAGRFALSRIVSSAGDLNFGQVIPDGATQEVRVYQTESGDLLLKVPTTPVTRYAENFDLTEDGLVAAVVNAGVIQVYKLRRLSAQDEKDLAEAKSFSPPVSKAPVNFARLAAPESGEGESESSSAAPDVAGAMTPDMGSLGSGGGTPAAPAPAAPGAPDASGATQGGAAVAPPGADVTKASGGSDPASSSDAITDAEARAVMARTQPAATAEPAAKADSSSEPETGRRKPPTLLGPGENVEKVKAPTQQQSR